MALKTLGKIAATLMLGGALTGCIDAKIDVELTSETTAKATMTQVMGPDFYAMVKMAGEEAGEDDAVSMDEFCADGDLTEDADGGATCVEVTEGAFDELQWGDEESIVFASAGAGLVRVSLPTAEMKAGVGAEDEMDEETKQMMEGIFAGHSITVTFSGVEVTETNMTVSADGKSAETVIPFLDLINGGTELPEEFYAIVKTP